MEKQKKNSSSPVKQSSCLNILSNEKLYKREQMQQKKNLQAYTLQNFSPKYVIIRKNQDQIENSDENKNIKENSIENQHQRQALQCHNLNQISKLLQSHQEQQLQRRDQQNQKINNKQFEQDCLISDKQQNNEKNKENILTDMEVLVQDSKMIKDETNQINILINKLSLDQFCEIMLTNKVLKEKLDQTIYQLNQEKIKTNYLEQLSKNQEENIASKQSLIEKQILEKEQLSEQSQHYLEEIEKKNNFIDKLRKDYADLCVIQVKQDKIQEQFIQKFCFQDNNIKSLNKMNSFGINMNLTNDSNIHILADELISLDDKIINFNVKCFDLNDNSSSNNCNLEVQNNKENVHEICSKLDNFELSQDSESNMNIQNYQNNIICSNESNQLLTSRSRISNQVEKNYNFTEEYLHQEQQIIEETTLPTFSSPKQEQNSQNTQNNDNCSNNNKKFKYFNLNQIEVEQIKQEIDKQCEYVQIQTQKTIDILSEKAKINSKTPNKQKLFIKNISNRNTSSERCHTQENNNYNFISNQIQQENQNMLEIVNLNIPLTQVFQTPSRYKSISQFDSNKKPPSYYKQSSTYNIQSVGVLQNLSQNNISQKIASITPIRIRTNQKKQFNDNKSFSINYGPQQQKIYFSPKNMRAGMFSITPLKQQKNLIMVKSPYNLIN